MNLLLIIIFAVLILIPVNIHAEEIPKWIKTIVGWWVEDQITDGEFVDAMEYVFEKKLIYVNPKIENDFLREIAVFETNQKIHLFETSLNLRSNHVEFLSEIPEIQSLATLIHDEKNFKFDTVLKNNILKQFQKFAESDNAIDQIRILNMTGMEILRINNVNDNLVLVSDNRLQEKSHKEYFSEILTIGPHDVYISKINLNEEFNKVQIPYTPTIRIGTVIHDSEKDFVGILLVNYNLQELLDNLSQSIICDVVIFDQDGTSISHYDEMKEFGIQLGTNFSYFDEHPEIQREKNKDLGWYFDLLNQKMIIKQKAILENSENSWHMVCELK